jgi:hypothetical protein
MPAVYHHCPAGNMPLMINVKVPIGTLVENGVSVHFPIPLEAKARVLKQQTLRSLHGALAFEMNKDARPNLMTSD